LIATDTHLALGTRICLTGLLTPESAGEIQPWSRSGQQLVTKAASTKMSVTSKQACAPAGNGDAEGSQATKEKKGALHTLNVKRLENL